MTAGDGATAGGRRADSAALARDLGRRLSGVLDHEHRPPAGVVATVAAPAAPPKDCSGWRARTPLCSGAHQTVRAWRGSASPTA